MIMNKIVGVNDHEPSYFHLENCTGWVDLMASFPLLGFGPFFPSSRRACVDSILVLEFFVSTTNMYNVPPAGQLSRLAAMPLTTFAGPIWRVFLLLFLFSLSFSSRTIHGRTKLEMGGGAQETDYGAR